MDRANPYKIVVLGAGAVGKSSVTLRFVTGTFATEYVPTIEDCYRKNTLVDDRTAYLDILDTAGQEEYTMLRDQWIRGGHGFLLVYSVNNRRSFEEIGDFRDRVLQVKEAETAPMVLVGNKCDLAAERTVTFQEGKSLADKFGMPFLECSALTGLNCDAVFHDTVRAIRAHEERVSKRKEEQQQPKKRWSFCVIL